MNNFFVFFIVTVLCAGSNKASLFPKNKISFQNNLSRIDDVLEIHCRSEQDDLGVHFLHRSLDVYEFEFGDSFLGGTYHRCVLSHGVDVRFVREIVAYEEEEPYFFRFGSLILWEARDDGIYLTSDDGDPNGAEKMYDW